MKAKTPSVLASMLSVCEPLGYLGFFVGYHFLKGYAFNSLNIMGLSALFREFRLFFFLFRKKEKKKDRERESPKPKTTKKTKNFFSDFTLNTLLASKANSLA